MPGLKKNDKKVTASGPKRRGEGLGTGPVGNNQQAAKKAASGSQHFGGQQFGTQHSSQQQYSGKQQYSSQQQYNSQQQASDSQQFGAGYTPGGASHGMTRATGRKMGLGGIIAIVLVFLLLKSCGGGGGLLSGLLGGGGSSGGFETQPYTPTQSYTPTTEAVDPGSITGTTTTYDGSSLMDLFSALGMGGASSGISSSSYGSPFASSNGYGSYSSGWSSTSNNGQLNTSVATGTPAKRTRILGNGKDQINILVYMCGTDLESSGGAATSDLQEMLNAEVGDNINLIIYTGGCKRWKNGTMSSQNNQIYQIRDKKLYCLNSNVGNAAMTNPDTLASFLKWAKANYSANRNMLIFWDHGGGSISGYGYDEKYPNSGAMSLSQINKALKAANMDFDFIGFDACLMATLENGLMLSEYADYMIASEEVEPGIGWYYTDWLTALDRNTSMDTLTLGKNIADSFYAKCRQQSSSIGTTLSVTDLAELAYTVPDLFEEFSLETADMVTTDNSSDTGYKTIINARKNSREFGASSKIDQIDLVDLAQNMGTDSGERLAKALKSAVKYNCVASSMTDAYGLTIYFPYSKPSYVKVAAGIYKDINLSTEYTKCIQKVAAVANSGQYVNSSSYYGYGSSSGSSSGSTSWYDSAYSGSSSGYGSGYGSSFGSLLGALSGQTGSSSAYSSSDISSLLGSFLGSTSGSSGSSYDYMSELFGSGRALDLDATAAYIADNSFDGSQLIWSLDENGTPVIELSEEQWSLITDIGTTMFYDDGEGYIDLGSDSSFVYDEAGRLVGQHDGTWLSVDGQVVPYYFEHCVVDGDNYCITGYVPALYNGVRAELEMVFDTEHEDGYFTQGRYIYLDGETETTAKGFELEEGAEIEFIADYYTYEGEYDDTYRISDVWNYRSDAEINNNSEFGDAGSVITMYRLQDIYGNLFWTEAMPR